jgi:hypothetical protein
MDARFVRRHDCQPLETNTLDLFSTELHGSTSLAGLYAKTAGLVETRHCRHAWECHSFPNDQSEITTRKNVGFFGPLGVGTVFGNGTRTASITPSVATVLGAVTLDVH